VAGEIYLTRVRSILQDIDEAHRVVSSQTHELAGVLRILAPPVLATHVLGPVIADFRQRYPKIVLNIDVATFKEPPIEDYDITLMVTDATFDADVIARKITSTEAILVASPAYIQRKGKPTTPQELSHHEILQFKAPGLRPGVWRLFNSERQDEPFDLVLEPSLWANDSDTLLRAALDGAGITSTAVELVAPYLSRGELVRVVRPWIADRLSLYAALPSRKFLPERTRVFLDYLSERIRTEINKALQACEAC
jgi:DNA-binding transcriptional LysR family regulator